MAGSSLRNSLQRALRFYLPPAGAALCFAYAGYDWYTSGEDAKLRQRLRHESDELDQRRVEWLKIQERKTLYRAETVQEVHNLQALGPAGVLLKQGEDVEVLEEGQGMEQGFSVVRRSTGAIGIYPKPYLRQRTS
mmetsp:Transcript_48891/g.114950  ORF Transcript_48891/g.114950 Transcript_48891/m.114950 type:complete len:135 (+) Transcript_48891:27-431(+)